MGKLDDNIKNPKIHCLQRYPGRIRSDLASLFWLEFFSSNSKNPIQTYPTSYQCSCRSAKSIGFSFNSNSRNVLPNDVTPTIYFKLWLAVTQEFHGNHIPACICTLKFCFIPSCTGHMTYFMQLETSCGNNRNKTDIQNDNRIFSILRSPLLYNRIMETSKQL